jgi:nucleoside-diphosphate-sugar epimerase
VLSAVTGGGGHLGGVVVRDLIEASYDVRAVDLNHADTLDGLDVDVACKTLAVAPRIPQPRR